MHASSCTSRHARVVMHDEQPRNHNRNNSNDLNHNHNHNQPRPAPHLEAVTARVWRTTSRAFRILRRCLPSSRSSMGGSQRPARACPRSSRPTAPPRTTCSPTRLGPRGHNRHSLAVRRWPTNVGTTVIGAGSSATSNSGLSCHAHAHAHAHLLSRCTPPASSALLAERARGCRVG